MTGAVHQSSMASAEADVRISWGGLGNPSTLLPSQPALEVLTVMREVGREVPSEFRATMKNWGRQQGGVTTIIALLFSFYYYTTNCGFMGLNSRLFFQRFTWHLNLICKLLPELQQAFFVRTLKKLKGAKNQENGNSRKKIKLKKRYPFSGIFLGQIEKKQQSENLYDLPQMYWNLNVSWRKMANFLKNSSS